MTVDVTQVLHIKTQGRSMSEGIRGNHRQQGKEECNVRQSSRRHLRKETDTQRAPERRQESTLQQPQLDSAIPTPWFK